MKNKYQEALDYLVSNGTHRTEYSWGDEIEVETERGEESVKLLQELVDKETPMKPNYHYDHSCWKCGSVRIKDFNDFVNEKYCSNCGQKIDWSDNNDY